MIVVISGLLLYVLFWLLVLNIVMLVFDSSVLSGVLLLMFFVSVMMFGLMLDSLYVNSVFVWL